LVLLGRWVGCKGFIVVIPSGRFLGRIRSRMYISLSCDQ
jgi:hypothetical protein